MGGWSDARPRVADSSLAEGRFKFFLGSTEWDAGQLEDEFRGSSCRPFESPHVLTSQRHKDLAGRTTPEAAACTARELRPSAYAWMLDLGRRHPPPRNASR